MNLLQDRIALVTGASSGIGRACAKLFSAQGATLVLVARRQPPLESLAEELTAQGSPPLVLCGDVREESFHQEISDKIRQHFGTLHIALNNAGILGPGLPLEDTTLVQWNETLNSNLTSAFLGSKYQLPLLRTSKRSSLIFTSSFVGYTLGMPGMTSYAASKAGLIGLTKSLALEAAPLGIRVNALLPGGTDTDMGRSFADTPEKREFVENLHALKRMASPEEIAHSALYLASEASSFTTGTALLADGGVSISRL